MDEIWKPIPDTDYAVSNTGKVASMKKGWRVLHPGHSEGYPHVNLHGGSGERRSVSVHQLVAEAFLGPRPTPKHEVNHRNGTRDDPHADNLEWVTRSENLHHRYDVLKHGGTGARGEANGAAKLTEIEVREILRRCATGETQTKVAADYGITQANVSDIARGKTWAWIK